MMTPLIPKCGRSSGVERNLAKVEVEGSNPFARSSVTLVHSCNKFDSFIDSVTHFSLHLSSQMKKALPLFPEYSVAPPSERTQHLLGINKIY